MELSPGDKLGPYEILGVLGRGGMGVVYRARHTGLDRATALKILHPDLVGTPEFVRRFTQEARLAAQLVHPNLAAVYDFGEIDGRQFLAMQFVEGVPLSSLLSGPLPLELTVSILKQICAALSVAHVAGVVHRDLKPSNIMVNPDGVALLTDFGIAKSAVSTGLTQDGSLIGTPEYMAPEQATGKAIDRRADLYSLGIILYEACAGSLPFMSDAAVATALMHVQEPVPLLKERVPDIPDWVDGVIQRCCAKDPDERFQSAVELSDALQLDVDIPLPVYPDILERAGVPDFGSTLTAILRGQRSLTEALSLEQSWENAIREALEREVTVVSLDVVGSRRMKAPGSTLLLSYLFERFRRFIDATCDAHECVAKAWSGDGLAAVFDDPQCAIEAMLEVIRRLGEFDTPDPDHPFRVRVGIHAGRVLLPSDADIGRVTSRVFDTAGFLQKTCPPNEIWASEEVVRGADMTGSFEPHGRVEDVYVYCWRALMPPTPAPSRPTPVVTPAHKGPPPTPARRPTPRPSRKSRTPLFAGALTLAAIVVAIVLFVVSRGGREPAAPTQGAASTPSAAAPFKEGATAQSASGTVSGRVLDSGGNPAGGAYVWAWAGDLRSVMTAQGTGRYRVFGLPRGPRVVVVTKSGFTPGWSEVRVGGDDTSAPDIALRPASVLASGAPQLRVTSANRVSQSVVEATVFAQGLEAPFLVVSSARRDSVVQTAPDGSARITVDTLEDPDTIVLAITSQGWDQCSPLSATSVAGPAPSGGPSIAVTISATSPEGASVRPVVVELPARTPLGAARSGDVVISRAGTYAVGVECLSAPGAQASATVTIAAGAQQVAVEQVAGLVPLYDPQGNPAGGEGTGTRNVGTLTVAPDGSARLDEPAAALLDSEHSGT